MNKSRIDNKACAQEMLNNMKEIDFPYLRNAIYPIQWVNVGILYPQYNVNVLLTDGKNIGFGYLAENERYKHWKSHQDLGWITHWMPLPETPKEIK